MSARSPNERSQVIALSRSSARSSNASPRASPPDVRKCVLSRAGTQGVCEGGDFPPPEGSLLQGAPRRSIPTLHDPRRGRSLRRAQSQGGSASTGRTTSSAGVILDEDQLTRPHIE